ncbi:MAG: hypothetical protein ACTSPI_16705 [Candidatus Heimdallarchaeaceae archaeon]
MGIKAIKCPVCGSPIIPKKMSGTMGFKRIHRCYRCGNPTTALNTLCWKCESKARKTLRVKPEWKKTYKKEMTAQGGDRVGRPRPPDKR